MTENTDAPEAQAAAQAAPVAEAAHEPAQAQAEAATDAPEAQAAAQAEAPEAQAAVAAEAPRPAVALVYQPHPHDNDEVVVDGITFKAFEPVALDAGLKNELIAKLKRNPWFAPAGEHDPDRLAAWLKVRDAQAEAHALRTEADALLRQHGA